MPRKPVGPYELLAIGVFTAFALVGFCAAVYAGAYLLGVC